MQRKKIFLLDALALIYRAHFAFIKNPRKTSDNRPTSAVYGFLNSLFEVLEKEKPYAVYVAFDRSEPTFRHEMFPEYKAHRDEVPEDIVFAIPIIKDILAAMNIPVISKAGYEADDIIGTMAYRYSSDYEVYMMTIDKDYAQLVKDHIFLYKPATRGGGITIYTPEKVKEKFGVPPSLIIDYLGLRGDASDNIPGVPKVGEKTAIQLINEFGTVEEILENTEKITKKSIRESMIANKELAVISKKLATIITDVPIEQEEIDDWSFQEIDKTKTLELFKDLEFRRLTERLLRNTRVDLFSTESSSETISIQENLNFESSNLDYKLIDSEEELEKLVKSLSEFDEICFDTETSGLDAMLCDLVGISFAVKENKAFYLSYPKNKDFQQKYNQILAKLFQDSSKTFIGQNLKFDLMVLTNHGIEVNGNFEDTMLMDYVLNPDLKHNMNDMSKRYLNYTPIPIETLIGKKGKKQLSMANLAPAKIKDYACEDADITLRLYHILSEKLKEDEKLFEVYKNVERFLMPVLLKMELNGVKIDNDALLDFSKELELSLEQSEQKIYAFAGEEFNINSPKQLGEIIFGKLQLAKGKKTKTGQFSTNEQILLKLAEKHDMPAEVLNYRQLAKLKSTYVDALPKLVNPKTDRIHTTFSQAIAATGRLSSNHPNLQNIPIRTELGREVRKAFIPSDNNHILLSADYSQIELRIMAALSNEKQMIQDFNDGLDIHSATAARVFAVDIEEVSSDMRRKAKMVNFGIIYGISAFGLAQRLKISRSESKQIIDTYFEKYPEIQRFMDECIENARETGYAETMLGRKRYLRDILSQNAMTRSFAERTAINSPIQGTAADMIKIAMININREMRKADLRSKMILQVHDELVFDAEKIELDILEKLIHTEMVNALELPVPIEVNIGKGINWLEAH